MVQPGTEQAERAPGRQRGLWRPAAVALVCCVAGACEQQFGFRDVQVGQEGDRELRVKSNSQFVRSLLSDVLSRAPSEITLIQEVNAGTLEVAIDEEATLVGMLDGVGDTFAARRVVGMAILSAAEASLPHKEEVDPEAFVDQAFAEYLGRDATPYERAAFVDAWHADPAVGPRAVLRAIVMSRAYQGY